MTFESKFYILLDTEIKLVYGYVSLMQYKLLQEKK